MNPEYRLRTANSGIRSEDPLLEHEFGEVSILRFKCDFFNDLNIFSTFKSVWKMSESELSVLCGQLDIIYPICF